MFSGNERLLTDAERQLLQSHYTKFEQHLKCDDILSLLFSNQVLDFRQKQDIQAKETPYKKNRALYDEVMSCSYAKVLKFREVLRENGQELLANLLDFSACSSEQQSPARDVNSNRPRTGVRECWGTDSPRRQGLANQRLSQASVDETGMLHCTCLSTPCK